jgi:hypothetical protein
MVAKKLNNENMFLKQNTQALLRNFISIILFNAQMTSEQLAKVVGMAKDDLEKFLDIMTKENKIKKDGDKYTVVKNVKREKQD